MSEDIAQPDWTSIVDRCKQKIIEKFPQYGNAWMEKQPNGFWERRLQREVDEFKNFSPENKLSRIEELTDIINISSMIITNILEGIE